MAQSVFQFFNWNVNYTYTKWDTIYGANASDTRYFYSTTDGNLGANPTAQFVYTPTSAARTNNVARVSFTQTGSIYFQPGSIVALANLSPDPSLNYTGTVLAAGPGYVDYLNAGLNVTNAISAGSLTAPIHPYWTTGFYWIPSWTTDVNINQAVINTQLGEGYSQRMNPAINANALTWGLVYDERPDKEIGSLLNFIQDKGGVTPFVINFPMGKIFNNPSLKYITVGAAQTRLSSYGLNGVSIAVQQVFDL